MAHVSQPPPRRGKGKIRPPRKLAPDTGSPELWATLSHSIREIHNHNAANLSFEENFRYAYNMVLHRQGDVLYNGVNALVSENLDRMAKDIIAPSFPTLSGDQVQRGQEGERLLKAIREVWDDHIGSMSKLRDLLKYMDRVYTPANGVPPIYESGLQLFLERIIRSTLYPIRQHVVATLLDQIRVERDGFTINRSTVKSCVEVMLELKGLKEALTVYKKEFEPVFLKESDDFYRLEGERLLESCDAPEYLRRVEARLESERSRTQYYLSSATEVPLLAILKTHLLTAHLSTIISMPSSGLDVMIDGDKTDDLARLYRLFVLVPEGLPSLKKTVKESVLRRGKEVNALDTAVAVEAGQEDEGEDDAAAMSSRKGKEPERRRTRGPPTSAANKSVETALQWVQGVIDLKDRFDKLLKICFADDISVQTSVNEAFESFINMNKKSPEYISLFIDDNLRRGLKGKSDDEVDIILDKTITVFRFIAERDVFERYYKTHLSKRLLSGRSVSDDAERGMLAKLKVECGFQFTQKLEGMFHDMKISEEHMSGYRLHLAKSGQSPAIDISVYVLTSTFWPVALVPTTCTFPAEMTQACEAYQRFYLSRHNGRRLTWQPSMGSADIKVTFKAKRHDLNVSTYALIILLLFEDLPEGDILTYEEIKAATNIVDAELQRHLQSLACAKFKVLKKHPPGRDVSTDDSFSFNHDFTSPMQRIKISTIASKVEDTEQSRETMEKVEEERKHQIEACIVRIMKDRKMLSHNELINEVTRQLSSRFQPNPGQIKKRIEALIERDYLERGQDKKSYVYMA